eukprot:4233358-Pleurochrysis_carterae.AAC.1
MLCFIVANKTHAHCRRIRKYYTRFELNAARVSYNWPAGHRVPEIGKYVEEGVKGNLPSPTGRLKFTA